MQSHEPSAQAMIEAIRSAFGRDDPAQAGVVSKSEVLKWMRAPNIEVRGALYSKIANAECAKHIEPPLQFDDYFNFVVPYLEQCIEQDPGGEWSESRYLAGHALVGWVVNFWNNKEVPREKLADVKGRLGDLYRRGDEGVRDGVLNGVLEHLFENRQLADYFKDWKTDPVLGRPYGDALLWAKTKLTRG